MQFNTPTTKEQMYTILNDIFYYYRIKRPVYEGITLKKLSLERLRYTPPTDEELLEIAKTMVAPDAQREIDERKEQINSSITSIESKIAHLQSAIETQIAQVESLYQASVEAVEKQAFKNGLISSGIMVDKITVLEEGKNEKITQINLEKDRQLSELNAQLLALRTSLDNVEEYFALAHEKDAEKKLCELIAERQEKIDEVFKYNNSLDEKEQRSQNTINQVNASLELRFYEINLGEFSKDQLVTMGYYDDVIKCVCGYYNTLEPMVAYQDVNLDKKLPIYLDDYYHNILYMYKARADA